VASDSVQHKLSRVRPPRVQITYDVETGGAMEKKELPLVVGVLADLSGGVADAHGKITPPELLPIRKRKFVEIDRDNFNDVMKSIGRKEENGVSKAVPPSLTFSVKTVDASGAPTDAPLKVELTFKSIEDFRPEQVAKNVPALKDLLKKRRALNDLLAKLDGNEALMKSLQAAAKNADTLAKLKALPPAKIEGGDDE
jgi:type VI secretion system protein ImpB